MNSCGVFSDFCGVTGPAHPSNALPSGKVSNTINLKLISEGNSKNNSKTNDLFYRALKECIDVWKRLPCFM